MLSNETITMPSARACWTTGTSAVGVLAMMTIACAPLEIMFSMAAICSASLRSAVLTWKVPISGLTSGLSA